MLRSFKVFFLLMFTAFLTFISTVKTAHAYIDPGSAGLLYQVVIMLIAAIIGYFAFLRKKIGGLFGIFKKKDRENEKDS